MQMLNFPATLPVVPVRDEIAARPYIAQRDFCKTEETSARSVDLYIPHAEFCKMYSV